MEEKNERNLELIGFLSKQKSDSKEFMLLQVILRNQIENSHLTFSEIYNAFKNELGGVEVSKAWVHRLVKSLIDNRIVESESKNRYSCDIGTLTSGLSFLKQRKLEDIEERFAVLTSEKDAVEAVNASELAKRLYETLTGTPKIPASRFLKGLDEFQRVTNETIYHIAKEGDIIRTSVTGTERFGSEPFIDSFAKRIKRVVVAASKGVDVRYTIPPIDLGNVEQLWKGEEEVTLIENMLNLIAEDDGEGPGFHFRFNPVGQKSHQFVSLNNEVLALWISEYPPTAAWMTREFNADLIDDITKTFDEQWEQSFSVRNHLEQTLAVKRKK